MNASVRAATPAYGHFPAVNLAEQVLNGLLDRGEVAWLALPAAEVGPVVSDAEKVVVDDGTVLCQGRHQALLHLDYRILITLHDQAKGQKTVFLLLVFNHNTFESVEVVYLEVEVFPYW